VQHIVITKAMDEHSPGLLEAMMVNKDLSSAVVHLSGSAPDAVGPGAAATKMTLQHVRVDSVQQAAGAAAIETVALSFSKVAVDAESDPNATPVDAPAQLEVEAQKSGKWSSPVLEWSWGLTTPVDAATGMATGKRQMQEFSMVVPSGPMTVHFIDALQNHEMLKQVALTPKAGPAYALANGRVTDLQMAAGPDAKTTTVRLAYQTVSQQTTSAEFQDSWGEEAGGAAPKNAGAKESAPGPGKAGTMKVTLGGAKAHLPIEAFSFGTSSPRDAATGQATGKVKTSDVTITRHADAFSPLLMQAISTNKNLGSLDVELVMPAAEGKAPATVLYTFETSHLRSFSESGGAGASIEHLSFGFSGYSMVGPPVEGVDAAAVGGPGSAGEMQLVGLDNKSADFGLTSATWGIASPSDAATGQASGKRTIRDLTITKSIDGYSPSLIKALSMNQSISSGAVTLKGNEPGPDGVALPAGVLHLKGLHVTSIQQSSGGQPVESVSFGFNEFEMSASGPKDGADINQAPAKITLESNKIGTMKAAVTRWSWGASTQTDRASGQATGRRQMHNLTFVMPVVGTTVQLLQAIETNDNLKNVTLAPKSGIAYNLGNARVVEVALASDEKGSTATIQLAYATVGASIGGREFSDSWAANV